MSESDSVTPSRRLHVVVLGASAGGLEALRPLVAALQPNGTNAYIVAQHMAPHHRSALAELLATRASLPVEVAVDGRTLDPDRVYVAPPDSDVTVEDGRIVLRPGGERGPRPSIDRLLTGLAEQYAAQAVAVILSGTGSDGARGAQAVKARGGLVLAQRPETARHDGMPTAVIRTGLADLVLHVDELGRCLSSLADLGVAGVRDGGEPGYPRGGLAELLRHVFRETGVDFTQYRETTLSRQVERRRRALALPSLASYVDHARGDAAELGHLQRRFLISVTSFFRDPHVFDALRASLAELLERGVARGSFRVWVPGCASGEEAYSLAILLAEALGPRWDEVDLKIFATDIDLAAADVARRGIYPTAAVAGLDAGPRERWVVPVGDSFKISRKIRALCVFSRHDVVGDPPFLGMDLVSCRNLLIYFQQALQAKVLTKLHSALEPGGLLLLGRSESAAAARRLFTTVDARSKIYGRRPADRVRTRTGLRPRRPHHVEVPTFGGRPWAPAPMEVDDAALGGAAAPPEPPPEPRDLEDAVAQLAALRQELTATRQRLAATTAQLEATSEDFRTLTEEMQASTEELQASNEELQTTNEELHAANEELTTLNDELHARSTELLTLNDTLAGIQGSIPVGMVLVDQELRVLRFNPLAVRVFGLVEADVGQSLLDAPCLLEGVDLRGLAERVMSEGRTLTEHRRTSVADFLMQVSPYLGASGACLGALLTFADISDLRRAELALAESEIRFTAILEAAPNALLVVDTNGRIARANARAEALFEYPPRGLDGVEVEALMPQALRQAHRGHRATYQEAPVVRSMRAGLDLMAQTSMGRMFDTEISLAPILIGGVPYVVANVVDISARVAAERTLRQREEKYRLVIDTTTDGFVMVDAQGRILEVNAAYERGSGYTRDELQHMTIDELVREEDAGSLAEHVARVRAEGGAVFESQHRTKDGHLWPCEVSATWADHGGGRLFGFVRDISARRRAEEEIKNLAYYDVLTGLPNRRLLLDRIRRAMAASARAGTYCALLFIDLDHFKLLNDTLGHEVGDRLLTEVARRLEGCVRKADTVARLGGDEFVVMLEGLDPARDKAAIQVEIVGTKILRAVGRTHELAESPRRCTSSVGVSLFARHDLTVDELLKQTDLAMYQAKGAGRNALRFFDATMQATVEARALLEAELLTGVRKRQLELYYQVQVDAHSRVIGAEALVRWWHPVRGLVMPAEFIPVAEGTSLILPLGQEVLRQACETLARWSRDPRLEALTLAVNVSARQFRASNFVRQVATALQRTKAPPQRLRLELTESMLIDDVADTVDKMMALRALGVTFSLDDFGIGYSSLAYLKRLPLDQIKIDRSFVSDLLTNANDAVIARAVAALGRSLGLRVIAEGVESIEQWQFLQDNGCQAGQGYYFGRPEPLDAFEARAIAGSAPTPR